jgi:hypothetical protein
MDERAIFTAAVEHQPPHAGASEVDAGTPGPLHDPRALTILTTEHWSLLSARSLVYNEAFARTGMFLTFLSASTVALALVAQAMGFDHDFLLFATAILAFDLFIALATLGRITDASNDDLRSIQGMNRLRHAYLEIVPGLEPYLIASRYDDLQGVLSTYGEPNDQPSFFGSFLHGLTTTPGMVAVIASALAGLFGGVVALDVGASAEMASVVGIAAFAAFFVGMLTFAGRAFNRFGARLAPRFPTPPEG